MLLKEFFSSSVTALSKIYPDNEAGTIAGILCREYLGVESYTHIIEPELELPVEALRNAGAALSRLLRNEPLQYVLGYAEFYGRRFNVSPSVLIPRPETETLCNEAIAAARLQELDRRKTDGGDAARIRILDLCTGSGCIAWTLALELPEAEVVAVDISHDALAVASSQTFGAGPAPRFVQADIFDDMAMEEVLKGGFDIIVSNPPYILESEKDAMRPNVLDYEPALALFVPDGDSMVFNGRIAEISKKAFNADSVGFIEINSAQDSASWQIFKSAGFSEIEIVQDIFGANRFLKYS